MTDPGVRFSVDGPIARVRLDRPEVRNAQTPAMWEALADFGTTLPSEVRVVVVSGEGVSFSAGLDRNLMGELLTLATSPDVHATIDRFQQGFSWLRRPEFVSIATVQGHAIGAGFQLALACDLRIATPDARFSMREPALGLVPDLGGTQPLVELVGYSRALEICATTRFVDADEALRWGLANIVVSAEELSGTIDDLAAAILTSHPGAVRETKALLLGAPGRAYDEQLRLEREAQARRLADLVGSSGGSGML